MTKFPFLKCLFAKLIFLDCFQAIYVTFSRLGTRYLPPIGASKSGGLEESQAVELPCKFWISNNFRTKKQVVM